MKRFFSVIVAVNMLLLAAGQQEPGTPRDKLNKVIPPSPEAASLGKFGDVPIGLSTGIPQISIPIYGVQQGDLKLPISVSYHAGGVRVSETPSSVGLGWTLNSGGVITRAVRGYPDESNKGYFSRDSRIAPLTIPLPTTPLTSAQYSQLENLAYGYTDVEPDLFVFNFGGRSGKFFFDHNQNIHMVSPEDIRIETSGFSTWKITDENGTQYFFEVAELTTSLVISDPNADPENFTSSWYLSKIISATGNQIDLIYATGEYISQGVMHSEYDFYTQLPQVLGDPCYVCETKNNQIMRSFSSQDILTKRLLRIETSEVIVYFDRSTISREDLPGDYPLKDIRIVSKATNVQIKKFHFNYSYFVGNGYYGFDIYTTNLETLNKRLKLLSIEQFPSENNQSSMPIKHEFIYNETPLPPRNGYAQDHWGFYNGALSNQTMLPRTSDLPYGVIYGDRNSNESFMTAGTLIKIKYPTGGSTEFEYESNKKTVTETTRSELMQQIGMSDQPGGTQEIRNFEIFEGQYCQVTYQVTYGNYPAGSIQAQLIFTDQNNNVVLTRAGAGNLISSNFFQPGQYTMKMISPDIPESNLYADIRYLSAPVTQTTVKSFGGLRIKRMKDIDGVTSETKIKRFEYSEPHITGPLFSDDYWCDHKERASYQCGGEHLPEAELEFICSYSGRTSFPKWQFGSVTGGHVAYTTVTEKQGDNAENGKSVYTFSFEPPVPGGGFPYAPAMSYENRNGLLLLKSDFNSSGTLLAETVSSYTYEEKHKELSLKAGFLYDDPYHWWENNGQAHDMIAFNYFNVLSEKTRKVSEGTIQYGQSGSTPLGSGAGLFYDNPSHSFPTRTQQVNSKGETIKEITKYPKDYTSAGFIQSLINMNFISIPVEKYAIKVMPNGQEFVTGGTITTFVQGKAIPEKIWQLEINSPVALASFVPSQMDANGNFTKDSRYKEAVVFSLYDSKNNLLEQSKANDITQAYIWGYGDNYPVAQCTNSNYSSIAYSSFESWSTTGNWSYQGLMLPDPTAPTGSKIYPLSGSNPISKNQLDVSKTYIVSYWSKNGAYNVNGSSAISGRTLNGWTFYEHQVPNPQSATITISGTGYIDEVRLYPKGSLMTTLTYEPLIGVTSQSDANNRILYYQYDDFGRLALIRDQDKNILKKICYNYFDQAAACNIYYNAVASQNFTRNNCPSGYTGSSVAYTVSANIYMSTISQADADAKAQADIIANGQAYANANGICTPPGCTYTNCEWTAPNKHCVNGVCQTGWKIFTGYYFDVSIHKWVCTYHWEWSDGAWSPDYTELHDQQWDCSVS